MKHFTLMEQTPTILRQIFFMSAYLFALYTFVTLNDTVMIIIFGVMSIYRLTELAKSLFYGDKR